MNSENLVVLILIALSVASLIGLHLNSRRNKNRIDAQESGGTTQKKTHSEE
ncbi:MAG TPA: hypothetical protein VGK99_10280 [Acidobacteriota bacterium]|jgi:hypothetical protein